jgi:hypothetical protein
LSAASTEVDELHLGHADALHTLSDMLLRRYLVRDLLWCQACDQPWVPIMLRPLTRYYACLNRGCQQPPMPARLIEQRIWSRFVWLYGATACQVPCERRHEALQQALRRVLVCRGPPLRLQWWR